MGSHVGKATLRHILVVICLCASLATATRGRAATPPRSPDLVVLDSKLSGDLDLELEETLVELLGRLRLRIVGAGAANSDDVLALVSIEPNGSGAIVTVQQARPPNLRVRRHVQSAPSTALFRETLAHVVLGAVEPMLELHEEPARPTPPPPTPADQAAQIESSPPAPPTASSASWSLGARGGALWFVSERASAAFVGGAGGVTFEAPLRPSLAAEAGYMIPLLIAREGVLAEFSLFSLRARPGLELWAAERFAIGLDLGAGLDFVALTPRQSLRGTSTSRTTRLQPILGGALAGHLRLWHTLELVTRVGLDVDLAPRHWVIASADEQRAFFESGRVVPHFTLGLDWSPIGPGNAPKGASP